MAVPMGCCYPPVTYLRVDISLTFVKVGHMTLDVPAGSYKPDADKIFELINVWDHKCTAPRDCPHRSAWETRGAVTRFARRIGRHRQTLWNLRAPGKLVSATLITQIADVLRVEVADITVPEAGRLAA